MADVLNGQVEPVLVMLARATAFGAPVGQRPQQGHSMRLEERQNLIVEHVTGDAVLEEGLTLGDLPEGFLAAGLVEFLEAVEAVLGVAQNLAGLRDAAQLWGQFEQAHFVLDDFLFRCHV